MTEHTIPRTGKPPLIFRGGVLAEVSGQFVDGRDQNRWHEITVYRTTGENFVIVITLRSQWSGETDHTTAETCRNPSDVNVIIGQYDPTEHVQGFPSGPHFAEKQARLMADIRRRFAALATVVYGQLGSDFAETIA